MYAQLLLAALPALADARLPDRVELVDGKVIECRVLAETEREIVVREGTKERSLELASVKSVYSRADNQREAIERWRELALDDVNGVLELAMFCRRHDLLEEQDLFAWWVLCKRPDDPEAHSLLRHERTKAGWVVREGSRRREVAAFLQVHTDRDDPFELRTTHYELRTDLPMERAIEAALDLECHYRAYFDLFARPVGVFEVTEPMRANLHADPRSFPRLAGDRSAYYQGSSRTLEVDVSAGLDVSMLVHEATHALLDVTAVSTRAAKGVIPAWVDEGLAEYLAGGLRGDAGRLRFDPDALVQAHFVTHARARDPYDLSRVLNFGSSDFAASVRPELKYAEAYTLVHFALQGEGGRYRSGFHAFLRSCYAGQASATHFQDALGLSEERFERSWTTYVKAMSLR